MENNNSFTPPVNASDGAPILPPTENMETSEQSEVVSEQFGHTSDEHGYGTNEQGVDNMRNDLGSDYYNAQMGKRVNDLYNQEEANIAAENQAFENAWNAEDAEKEKTDRERILRVLANAKADIEEAEAFITNEKYVGKDGVIHQSDENPNPPTNATNMTPTGNAETASAPLPSTEIHENFSATSNSLGDSEMSNIPSASTPISSEGLSTEPSENIRFTEDNLRFKGKDGIIYSNREDAINSFKN